MRVSTFAQNLQIRQQVTELQSRMQTIQSQIATEKRASSFAGLGADASRSLNLRNQVTSIAGYQRSIAVTETRIEVMQQGFDRSRQLGEQASINVIQAVYENNPRLGTIRNQANSQFDELVSLLNRSVDGRHLFGGRETGAPPVAPADILLDGDPTTGQYGLKQIIADRRVADGVDHFTRPGQLSVAYDGTSDILTIEDTLGDAFGYQLKSVNAGTLTTTTVAGPPDQLTIDFTNSITTLNSGDTISIVLDLPDGSSLDISLEATRDPFDDRDGVFLVGTDDDTTAANYQVAVLKALREHAQVELKAASAIAAADQFFDSTPPKIVSDPSGTPQLVDDTLGRAVSWYRGDLQSDARASQQAKIDDGMVLEYGVRADEPALRDSLKQLAVLASVDFSDETDLDYYRAVVDRSAKALQSAGAGIADLIGEFGQKEELLVSVSEKQEAFVTLTNNQIVGIEDIDLYAATTDLFQLETQLQASYQVTARLQSLSIVNFL